MFQKLLDEIALSFAYRKIWENSLSANNSIEAVLSPHIRGRLDPESQALLELACKLANYVSDSCLAPYLYVDPQATSALLPKETILALKQFGYPIAQATAADTKNAPLSRSDETLSHFGLKYLQKDALGLLENRDVVDAGSYDGTSARFFLDTYPIDKVFCFEPDPENYTLLIENLGSLLDSQRIVATEKALSKTSGLATMSPAGVGTSRQKAALAGEPKIHVKTVSLDAFLQSHPAANIGLIKLDVEGDAIWALRGAMQTISTHRPILIVSFYHTPQEFAETPAYLMENFPGYAFKVRKVTPNLFKEHVMIGIPQSN